MRVMGPMGSDGGQGKMESSEMTIGSRCFHIGCSAPRTPSCFFPTAIREHRTYKIHRTYTIIESLEKTGPGFL
jgi:hypothetical protein